jgi:serine/threonine protein kinase
MLRYQDNELAAMLGTLLADTYRLDALIGEGGMGAVFRGHHVRRGRDFAIKVLHPDYCSDPELVKRFDREAQGAARLDHPNCVRVTEAGTTRDGTKYLVMELLEGAELQDHVHGPTEPRRAVELILQIVRGLEHAHAQGLIHRDLKPQNIFVTRDRDGHEVLKLVDFGIAKIVHGDGSLEQMTRAGMVFGTPQYMSPEQAQGQQVDARADLYAVGVLLYSLVCGHLPFNSDNLLALVQMQINDEPPPLPASVPPVLAGVVMRLLAKPREQRFPDASALRDALERIRGAWQAGGAPSATLVEFVAGPHPSGSRAAPALPDALRPRSLGFMVNGSAPRVPPRLMGLGGLLLLSGALAWWLM